MSTEKALGHGFPVTASAPATIGNVGPGFDVLGLAVGGLRDYVTIECLTEEPNPVTVIGRDAQLIPSDPHKNAATIAARAVLASCDDPRHAKITIQRQLPLSGGLGASAAASVASAFAMTRALGRDINDRDRIISAALEGETAVAGRHLDNVAPAMLGGLTLILSVDPLHLASIPIDPDWWVATVTPQIRTETRTARQILPKSWETADWTKQMAHTAALVVGFATDDSELVSHGLIDRFSEPYRCKLIPGFYEAQKAARDAGALACTISGSGPTLFALSKSRESCSSIAHTLQSFFANSTVHVGPLDREGARIET